LAEENKLLLAHCFTPPAFTLPNLVSGEFVRKEILFSKCYKTLYCYHNIWV